VLLALARICSEDDSVRAALLEAISDPDILVRQLAIDQAGAIQPPAMSALIAATKSENAEVRKRSLQVLKDLGSVGEAAIPDVIPLTLDSDRDMQGLAMGALRAIGNNAVPKMLEYLAQADTDAQFVIASAVVSIEARKRSPLASSGEITPALWRASGLGPEAEATIPALLEALRSTNGRTRMGAAGCLAIIGNPAIEPLVRILVDERSEVRHAAAVALTRIDPQNPSALSCLIEALGDEDVSMRENAADQLAAYGHWRGMPYGRFGHA